MDVETTVPRNVEERLGKDLAIGGDHDHIRREGPQPIHELRVACLERLEHRNSMPLCLHLHRRWREFEMPAHRPVRLGCGCHHLADPGCHHPRQDHGRQVWRTHEDDSGRYRHDRGR